MMGPQRQQEPDDSRREAMAELIGELRLFVGESESFGDLFARAHQLGRSDLNAVMWIALAQRLGGPMTAGELAGRLGLGASATTSVVDRLERRGHVRRVRDVQDRRRVTLEMEPAAAALAGAFFLPLTQRMAAAATGFDVDQLRTAADVVRTMTRAVAAQREEGLTASAPPTRSDETGVRR